MPKKSSNNRNAARRSKNSRNPFRRVPSYILWGLLVLVVVIYCVVFYRNFVTPFSFRWKALYGTTIYPDGKIRGIDISHYQDDIDWDKLRNAHINDTPIRFMFVKATEGKDIIDENFNLNFYNARKCEFVRGAYHFLSTTSSAADQARFFCKVVQLEDDDLPPVLDVENKGNLSLKQLQDAVLTWMNIVENHYGVTPILYTYYSFKMSYLNAPEFDKYPYWIAHYYEPELKYTGKWAFWQHTDAGHVDGISGYVDVDLFNGDYKDLMNMTIGQNKVP